MGNGREMGRRAEKVRETEVRNRNWGSNEWKREAESIGETGIWGIREA